MSACKRGGLTYAQIGLETESFKVWISELIRMCLLKMVQKELVILINKTNGLSKYSKIISKVLGMKTPNQVFFDDY